MKETPEYISKRKSEHDEAVKKLNSVYLLKSEEAPTATEESSDTSYLTKNHADLIEPAHNLEVLTRFVESSSELGPVIQSMVSNIIGYGYRILRRDNSLVDNKSKEKKEVSEEEKELLEQKAKLENFFEYANSSQSIQYVIEEAAWDFFLTGNAYFEITRNARGQPDGITRIPAYLMRASRLDEDPTKTKIKQVHRTIDGYVVKKKTESKYWRRYAQTNRTTKLSGTPRVDRPIWFKEFQDVRPLNRETGEWVKASDFEKVKREGKLANEVIHITSSIKRGPYGLPYHIGNIGSINGDIEAERVNLATLRNNNIPSMFVSVSGGQLTPSSVDRLTQFAESKVQGNDNRSRFVLLESETLDDDNIDTGRSKINITPLTHIQHNDAMFKYFSEECKGNIRRSYRIPEILGGRGEAISGEVVAANMKLADEQVFAQERVRFVDWINRKLLPELNITDWILELSGPNATDPATVVKLLQGGEKTGGSTPRIARMIMERVLGIDLEDFPVDYSAFNPDIPFAVTMAEIVKKVNEAGKNNPTGKKVPDKEMNRADQTEPTQQFTSDRSAGSDE